MYTMQYHQEFTLIDNYICCDFIMFEYEKMKSYSVWSNVLVLSYIE